MFISIRELQVERVKFDEQLGPGVLDFGPDLRQTSPLVTRGHAELVQEHRGGRLGIINDVRLVGDFSTQIELSCARCLDPVVHDLARTFDLLYRPQGVDRRGNEVSIHEADTEIGYYQGEGVLLEDVLREQVLLALPLKAVCREECKGYCPHCGQNLNLQPCNCAAAVEDARWAALKDLKKDLPRL